MATKVNPRSSPKVVTLESIQKPGVPWLMWINEDTGMPMPLIDDDVDVWKNVTHSSITMLLHISTNLIPQDPREACGPEGPSAWFKGIPSIEVTIPAGETQRLPRSVRYAIQQTHCQHRDCQGNSAFCRNDDHEGEHVVVAGVGIRLKRVGAAPMPTHPAIFSKGEPSPVASAAPAGLADRLAARVAGGS